MPYDPHGTPQQVQSPTELVLGYLASKGLQPTSANVRSALEMNAQNPGFIQGLVNQALPQPEAQASTTGSAPPPSSSPSGAPRSQAPSQPLSMPPVLPSGGGEAPLPAPTANNGSGIGPLIASLLGGGGLSAFLNKGIQEVPKPADVAGAGPRAPTPPTAPPDSGLRLYPQTDAPQQPQIGQTKQLTGPDAQNPLETAILKALSGDEVMPQVAGPQSGAPQLPAPQPKPAIPLPDHASNPVPFAIPQSTSQLSGMGEGIDWGKILGDTAKVAKKVVK